MRSTSQDHIRWSALSAPLVRTSLWLLGFALIGIWLADLEIRSIDPWTELARFGSGLIRPDFATFDTAVVALLLEHLPLRLQASAWPPFRHGFSSCFS